MKTLRICLFSEIPTVLERSSEYYYFAFDKLLLFRGQNPYYDPFVICESIPDDPVPNCLYILFDGSVKAYVDYSIVDVAEVEDSSQAEHLSAIGSTYYTMADRRYLDQQFRTLHLPYNNGTYDLTVAMANDILINEKCIIRYDPEKERWYMEGDHAPRPPRMYPLTGSETDSVLTEVEKHCIHTNIKLANKEDNILQIISSGLYASVSDKASAEDYEALALEYASYKAKTDTLLAAIETLLSEQEALVTEDSIMEMILVALEDYSDDIAAMVELYNSVGKELESISDQSIAYTDAVFAGTQAEIEGIIAETFSEIYPFETF